MPDSAGTTCEPLVVGLINNMSDGALESTERQFTELLKAGDRAVNLRVYSLPELPRSEAARQHIRTRHSNFAELWSTRFDGLIVTGMEPKGSDFENEPYWPSFAQLIDWADKNTISTIWSCLAAHAAAYRFDSIPRLARGTKLTGVFYCARRSSHPILDGCPSIWPLPHSRYYEVPETILAARGYDILGSSAAAGAGVFAKHRGAMHIFLQGHPEYDAETLALEYRRDIKRYLRGDAKSYPATPHGYFRPESEAALIAFRHRTSFARDMALMAEFPPTETLYPPPPPWQRIARLLYRNWLSYLAEQKSTYASKLASSRLAPDPNPSSSPVRIF